MASISRAIRPELYSILGNPNSRRKKNVSPF